MALKPYRVHNPFTDEMSFFMNEVAEQGGFAVLSTGGSGAATDQSAALCTYSSTSSGKVVLGILVTPMVNRTLTETALNPYNGEVQKGGKVLLNRGGVWNTNMIYPGVTPAAGGTAYLGPSGLLLAAQTSGQNPTVGVFVSSKDADGYAKVRITL